MVLLLLLITTYVQLSGWKYTPAFLTNQNHYNMPILNACFILDDDTQNSSKGSYPFEMGYYSYPSCQGSY